MSQPELVPFAEKLRAMMDRYGATFTVAEVGGEDPTREMQLITQGEKRLNTAYNFDFLDCPRMTPEYLAKVLARWPEGTWPSWAFSNHDAVRVVTRCAEGRDPAGFAKLMLLLLMCLRGNVFIYQGEELGLHHGKIPFERLLDPEAIRNWPETKVRDGSRTPMVWEESLLFAGFGEAEPWLPIDPRHPGQSVDVQDADPASVLHFARAAIALRKGSAPLRCGDFTLLRADETMLAFTRSFAGETVLCVFNLGHEEGEFAVNGAVVAGITLGEPSPGQGRWPMLSAFAGTLGHGS
jgi:alpha-glucosidase